MPISRGIKRKKALKQGKASKKDLAKTKRSKKLDELREEEITSSDEDISGDERRHSEHSDDVYFDSKIVAHEEAIKLLDNLSVS